MSLEDYKPYLTSIATGLAGSAAGGGLSYLNTKQEDDETPEDFVARRRQNTITGAVGGGSVGLAAPVVASRLSTIFNNKDSLVGNILSNLGGKTLQAGGGAIAGAAGGGAIGKVIQGKRDLTTGVDRAIKTVSVDEHASPAAKGTAQIAIDKIRGAERDYTDLFNNHPLKAWLNPASENGLRDAGVDLSHLAGKRWARGGSAVGAFGAIAAPWLFDKYMGD